MTQAFFGVVADQTAQSCALHSTSAQNGICSLTRKSQRPGGANLLALLSRGIGVCLEALAWHPLLCKGPTRSAAPG